MKSSQDEEDDFQSLILQRDQKQKIKEMLMPVLDEMRAAHPLIPINYATEWFTQRAMEPTLEELTLNSQKILT